MRFGRPLQVNCIMAGPLVSRCDRPRHGTFQRVRESSQGQLGTWARRDFDEVVGAALYFTVFEASRYTTGASYALKSE